MLSLRVPFTLPDPKPNPKAGAACQLSFLTLLTGVQEPEDDGAGTALIAVTWHAVGELRRAIILHRWEAARAELALLERTLLERDAG
jgi:hypothetical protein